MDFQSTVLSVVFWWWRKTRQQFLDSTAAVFWVLCSNNFQPNCKLDGFKMSSVVIVFRGNTLLFNADTLLASHFWEWDCGAICARLAFPTLSSVPQVSGIKLLWLWTSHWHPLYRQTLLCGEGHLVRVTVLHMQLGCSSRIHSCPVLFMAQLKLLLPIVWIMFCILVWSCLAGWITPLQEDQLFITWENACCGSSGGVRPHQGILEACGALKEQYVISPGWLHTTFN